MKNPLVAAGLALIAWSIGISFGPVGVFIAGVLLVAIGLSSAQFDGQSWNGCPTCGTKIDPNRDDDDVCQRCGTVVSDG
ncbi:zinc ribbon domain-containing protein [Haladaptatus sp. DFWS20]|uniref:zinc ribbon domain-containing protein n=1 Tax=Haladaptatus sp. DFWS20 TaxID=3403467 RepID=UPI003EBF7535